MGWGPTRLCVLVGLLVVALGLVVSPASAADEIRTGSEIDTGSEIGADGNATATAALSEPAAASVSEATAATNVELTQRLRLVPEQKGIYEIGHRYRLPDRLRRLEVTLPEGATVVSTSGFDRSDGRTYEWDGSTEEPRIDYRLSANRTVDQTGPIGTSGRLTFVDVGEWALVVPPGGAHSWSWVSGGADVGFERSMNAAEGATGNDIAYLGAYEEYTHTAHGQRFRLIVPASASLEVPPEELFASLSDASDRLHVGDRDETVFVVAAPTLDGVDWGVRGLHTGGSDMWVRDFERLDEADNVWLHEYVHTRQGYTTAADSRWFTEGGAVYYSALLAFEQDRISYETFRERLRRGERDDDSILARPDTWERNANYHIGALVAGDLDRQTRLGSDGERSLQDVFRRMNAKDGTVNAADVRSFLRDAGGRDVAAAGDRYTTTTDRPSAWDLEAHREAFGDASVPAQITYTHPTDGDALRVSGAYRNRSLDSVEAVTLVPGERLAVDVVATNVGGTDGDYEATLRVDDEPRATESGRLAVDESTRLTFEHTFDRPGAYTVSVGDATVRVAVREPATARVDGLAVNRSELSAGGGVEVEARVSNDADYPGEVTLSFTRNGTAFETRRVRLDADAEATVTVETRLRAPGTYVFGVADASAETAVVTVEEAAGTTAGSTPGFGVITAVLAVAISTGAVRWRGAR
ncbi:hypothetical protein [Halobellus sp. GM3]|uniref:hypothetical protein n=1 Tax=Halobellus sp. GM3 TaxID=3458410 RepID=UPI00403D65EF